MVIAALGGGAYYYFMKKPTVSNDVSKAMNTAEEAKSSVVGGVANTNPFNVNVNPYEGYTNPFNN